MELNRLLHRTTVALSQLQNLLRQATDVVTNLHHTYLLYSAQVDVPLSRGPLLASFPPLPPPPATAVPILSPTSSCDSAPAHPIPGALPRTTASQQSTTSSHSPPPPPKKKRQPPPPLNEDADWDAWDCEADLKLVELKTDVRLRPNWNYVARRVGFSIAQCKARWDELQDYQHLMETISTTPAPSSPPPPLEAPTAPLKTPSPHCSPHATYTPTTPPHSPTAAATPHTAAPPVPEAAAADAQLLSPAAAAANIEAEPLGHREDNHLPEAATQIGIYFL